jgi:hypothetical protein
MPTASTQRHLLTPNATELLLLKAAFAEPDAASVAFAAWKTATGYSNYDEIDFAATRLLPLVYRNLVRAGLTDPWINKLRGLQRYHWIQNAAAQQRFLEVAVALNDLDARFVVLEGLALWAGRYIDDLGERPLLAGELLLSSADAAKARRALASLGWQSTTKILPPIAGWQSEWWQSDDRSPLRINYRWLPKPYPVLRFGRLLEHAERVTIAGISLLIPDTTDQLLHACLSNRQERADGAHRTIWVADSLRILQRGGPRIDWDRLRRDATNLGCMALLTDSLACLRENFGVELSAGALDVVGAVNATAGQFSPASRISPASLWSRLAQTKSITRPWRDYAAAEETAERKPSTAAWFQYWGWRMRCEVERAVTSRRKRAALNR